MIWSTHWYTDWSLQKSLCTKIWVLGNMVQNQHLFQPAFSVYLWQQKGLTRAEVKTKQTTSALYETEEHGTGAEINIDQDSQHQHVYRIGNAIYPDFPSLNWKYWLRLVL